MDGDSLGEIPACRFGFMARIFGGYLRLD